MVVVFLPKVAHGQELFGSVTAKEICEEIKKQYNIDVDKRKVVLDGDIKSYGTFSFDIKFYNGVTATMSVVVCEE